MLTIHRSFERLATVPIFSPHTHSRYKMSPIYKLFEAIAFTWSEIWRTLVPP